MLKSALGIVGAGSFGREVMSLLQKFLPKLFPHFNPDEIALFFVDDFSNTRKVHGISVLSEEDFLNLDVSQLYFNVAIADPNLRESVVKKFKKSIAIPLSLIFEPANILTSIDIGEGVIIMPGTIVSCDTKIGDYVHLNFQSYIAHDCIIEDYVTVSPGVICCGYVKLSKSVFIGAGSSIKPGTAENFRIVGSNSILGIGSTLLENVPFGTTYAGNPAKLIKNF